MAVEARRQCGYRKIGGTYLVADGPGFACGRFPLALLACPLCDHRPPFTRGLQKITPKNVLHASPVCAAGDEERCRVCPLGKALAVELGGLAWVGGKFYSTETFQAEAAAQGISKRIGTVPEWLTVGETWIFLAHLQGLAEPCPMCLAARAAGSTAWDPAADCELCDGRPTLEHPATGTAWTPAVFFAFRPARLERIIPDTMPEEERATLRAQGLTLVEVPHDDPDHRGKADEE